MLSLAAIARRRPTATAVVDGDTAISFAKLFDKSQAQAVALGLDRDREIPRAFVAHNDLATVALIWALLERRIPILPLNPRWTEAERNMLVRTAGARLVDATLDAVESNATHVDGTRPASEPGAQLLIATSATSGPAKLVRLSRNALEAAASMGATHLRMHVNDRWLLSLNLSHIGGIAVVLRCAAAGAAVVIADPAMQPSTMTERIAQSGVTLASFVPTQLERLLSIGAPRQRIGTLRAVILGGAHASNDLVTRARSAGWPVLPSYGLSETGSQVCTQPLVEAMQLPPADDVGPALPGMEIKIEGGVICVRGVALFDGYCGDTSPSLDADGWFRTGDLGRLSDAGRLVPLGRRDECIVTGGEKVSALEVEAKLLEFPQILAVAVVGVDDSVWGQCVAAAVVLEPSAPPSVAIEQLRGAVAAQLGPHQRPRRWLAVHELPLNPNGKLNRPAVQALFGSSSASGTDGIGFSRHSE